MRLRLLVPLLAAALFASGVCSSLAVAAATVNGDKITESEVERELDTLRGDPIFGEALKRDPDTRGQRRREILRELIYLRVAEQQAKKLGVRVTRSQVERLVAQAASASGKPLQEFLKDQNLTLAEARKLAERPVLRFALMDKVIRRVDLDERTVKSVYRGQKERFVDVRLERITVRTPKEASQVAEDVEAGQAFSAVARDRSIDDLAQTGGDMGYVPVGQLQPDVAAVVGQAVEGGVTDPIERENGFEIYRVADRRTKTYDEVADEIRLGLTQEERDREFDKWLAGKVRTSRVVVNPKYGRFDKNAEAPSVEPSTGRLTP
jgi:parvulin-like peptidyl-prolyl isomerase